MCTARRVLRTYATHIYSVGELTDIPNHASRVFVTEAPVPVPGGVGHPRGHSNGRRHAQAPGARSLAILCNHLGARARTGVLCPFPFSPSNRPSSPPILPFTDSPLPSSVFFCFFWGAKVVNSHTTLSNHTHTHTHLAPDSLTPALAYTHTHTYIKRSASIVSSCHSAAARSISSVRDALVTSVT